jgi:hypothetical protein
VLLEHLRRIGREDLLIDEEIEILHRDDVRVLPAAEQLAFLATNRRVGFWVTLLAGAARVLVLAGGAIALLVLSGGGVGMMLTGCGLLALTLWLMRSLHAKLRKLSIQLPLAVELHLGMPSE